MPTIGVVGLGLMGSSFALAIKAARPNVTVVGCDRDGATVRKAIDRGIVTAAGTDLGAIEMADIVVVAVPILSLQDLFASLKARVAGKVVTDMASTKATVMGWATGAGIDLVGGHPMCGKEASGIDAAEADLYAGAPWVLTRDEPAITDLVRAVGAHPMFMDAETHDRLVAGVSHAAFLLSVGYVLAVASRPEWSQASKLAATGFRDMSRLAAGDADLYAGIARTNREHIIEALDSINNAMARLRRHLEADDPRLIEIFEEAHSIRERWARESTQS